MGLYDYYYYVVYELSDKRALNDVLLGTPWPTVAILFSYIYFVKVCGPKFMKNREPFKIEKIIIGYNIIQILWNLHIVSIVFKIAEAVKSIEDYSFWCMPLAYTDDNPVSKVTFVGTWHYSYNKYFDLLDTIFFVLRKKFNQVSYMHMYHHLIMSIASWICFRYGAGGNPTSTGILNSLVHVIMYTYYLLALLGCHKWLWWKRYLTQLQIIQFAVLLIHQSAVFFHSSCYYNTFISALSVVQAMYFLYLFSNFYMKTYKKGKNKGN